MARGFPGDFAESYDSGSASLYQKSGADGQSRCLRRSILPRLSISPNRLPLSLTGTTPAASGNGMPADGWQRVKMTYENTSDDEYTASVALVVSKGSGTAWFSCPQLEIGTVANSVNLLSNADFHATTVSGEQTLPADWGKSSNDLDTAPTGVQPASSDPDFPAALEGNYVQIEGRPDKDGYVGFAQEVDISGKKNDVLVCGGWANAHSVPNADTVERGFGIAVQLQNSSGAWSSYAMRPFNEHALTIPQSRNRPRAVCGSFPSPCARCSSARRRAWLRPPVV